MDKHAYDETVKRLKDANKVISALDPTIRSDGWEILRPFVVGSQSAPQEKHDRHKGATTKGGTLDLAALIEEHASDDDAAVNGLLAAAILFGTYGHGPYAPKEFADLGEQHRLLMPRMNNFLPRTKRDEKKIFRNTKEGWVITTSGGKWLASTFGVKRGTQSKADS
jgi:hypothetical protein